MRRASGGIGPAASSSRVATRSRKRKGPQENISLCCAFWRRLGSSAMGEDRGRKKGNEGKTRKKEKGRRKEGGGMKKKRRGEEKGRKKNEVQRQIDA